MGIYGMGNAFNLRYRPPQRMGMGRPPIPPAPGPMIPMGGGNFSSSTNVSIQNGPGGFWGFMTGLTAGFIQGGGLELLNKKGPQQIQQAQTTQQGDGIDKLANLRKLFSNYTIVDNGNGTYAANKNNETPIIGTYEELLGKLGQAQAQGATQATEPTTPTQATGDTGATEPTTPTQPTSPTRAQGSSGNRRVHVPNGWYRSDTQTGNENVNLKLSESKTAAECLDRVLGSKVDYLGAGDRERLTKELVKNNPSVFNADGSTKAGANWDKLDLPSIKYIQDNYVSNKQRDGAKVSYESKVDGQKVEKTSNTAGAQQANKTKAYQGSIQWNINHTTNSGTATAKFTDSTGNTHTYTVSTGPSFTEARAKADLHNQIQQKVQADGYTNVSF